MRPPHRREIVFARMRSREQPKREEERRRMIARLRRIRQANALRLLPRGSPTQAEEDRLP